MHGQTAMTDAPSARNRRGRKRKSGYRRPAGRLVARPVDYQGLAAAQPHRNWLPAAVRLSEKAGTVLGVLNLIGRISDHEYEAGRRYGVVVGAYLAMANAPRGTAGAGRGYDCPGTAACPPETCICLSRTVRYMDAHDAIETRAEHMAVNRVAVHDQPITADQLVDLRTALKALARHFGLTTRGKSGQ